MFESLYTFYCAGSNCDLKLISEDQVVFPVHVIVAAAGIPKISHSLLGPFDRIFKRTEYRVNKVRSDELRLVIQFAYLERCDLAEDATAALKLLQASVLLRMDKLKEYVLEIFSRNLDIMFAINMLTPAQKSNPLSLPAVQKSKLFLLRHLVHCNAEATSISLDDLRTLLRDDRLHAPHEEQVAEAVLHWTRFDRENRDVSLPQLLQLVRIAFLSPTYLDSLKNLPELSENRHAHAALEVSDGTVRAVQENAQLVVRYLPLVLRPRIPHCTILAIGGCSTKGVTQVAEVYDHIAERWTQVPRLILDTQRAYQGLQQIGNYLYMVGGTDGTILLNTAQRLDLRTFQWESLSNMVHRRNFVSTATINGLLYAFGGKEVQARRLDTCEVYDPYTNTWKRICPMSSPRSDAAVAVLKDKIYATGGYDGMMVSRQCEMYDPEADTWTSIPPLIVPRSGHSMAVYRDHIFVVGGFSGHERLTSVESFDPETQTWSMMSHMITPRSNFGLALVNNQLVAVGGYIGDRMSDEVEIYDIMHDKWYLASPLTEAKSALACIVIDDLAFSETVLSATSRDDSILLRDLTRERPSYSPDDLTLPLPHGTAELHPVVMGPLPQPWVELFREQEDEVLAQVEQHEEEEEEDSDSFSGESEDEFAEIDHSQ